MHTIASGLSSQYISLIELGRNPSLDTLSSIAALLGCKVSDIKLAVSWIRSLPTGRGTLSAWISLAWMAASLIAALNRACGHREQNCLFVYPSGSDSFVPRCLRSRSDGDRLKTSLRPFGCGRFFNARPLQSSVQRWLTRPI
ncbi:MAG: helix-turn-helix domain-containing protein [Paraburkholderia hospita]